MKRTISAMSGPGVIAHNRRSYIAENVDRNRTSLNIEYCYTDIRQMYHQLFDAALAEFNAKQKRKDRMIENYYEKICSGKQEKPFYEVIFQIGNKDDMSAVGDNGELAKTVLDEFMQGFQQRNPRLQVFSAHLHMDEAKPLLAQIVKVLRSLYSSYIFLLGKVNQLQADCERERKNGEHLKKQLQEVMLENKSLRGIAANYESVKKFFGNQEVDEAVKAIRQREQGEKRQEYAKGRSGLPGR